MLNITFLHLLQKYSREKSEELYDVLNRKHFIEGGVLNDLKLLLDAVDEVGLSREECSAFLCSHSGEREVIETVNRVHSLGIHSIPCLIIDGGRDVIDGAADTETVLFALRRVIADKTSSVEAGNEKSLSSTKHPPYIFQQDLVF